MRSAWRALYSEMVSNTRSTAPMNCAGATTTVSGAKEAPNAKHRAPTRTIPGSEERYIHLATLLSRPKRSTPLSRSPAVSNE